MNTFSPTSIQGATKHDYSNLLIHTVTGRVGSGKTYSAIDYTVPRTQQGYKTLICCPSTKLVDQVKADLLERNSKIPVTAIHSKQTEDKTAVNRIIKHLKEAATRPGGEVLIITHAAFERITFFASSGLWDVIYDEAPTVVWHKAVNLAQHANIVLDKLHHDGSVSARYSAVSEQTENDELDVILADHTGDEICNLLRDFAARLRHPHWATYVDSEQAQKFQINLTERGQGDHQLHCFGLLSPDVFQGYKSVTLMGAEFESTLAYLYWSQFDHVTFEPHPVIKPRQTIPNSHLINLWYGTERAWSKALSKKDAIDSGNTVSDVLDVRARKIIGDKPYAMLTNIGQEMFMEPGACEMLPHTSHGLNSFQKYDIAYIHAAFNPQSPVYAFMKEIAGIEGHEVNTAIAQHTMLQAAGRISIRDYDNTNQRHIIVPDRATAEFIAKCLDAASCKPLPGHDLSPAFNKGGRPRVHESDSERFRSAKRAAKDERFAELCEVNQWGNSNITGGSYPPISKGLSDSHFGSLFANKYQKYPSAIMSSPDTAGFINTLRTMAAEHIKSKESRQLISPSRYDPDKATGTKRGNENIISANGIWLDNDGGDLTLEEFARINAGLEMYIFNSFSSTAKKKKWRVFIPTTHLLGLKSYRYIVAEIIRNLTRYGYYGKAYLANAKNQEKVKKGEARAHGFDETKFGPAALFFLPGTSAARPHDAFWLDYNTGKRRMLNPFEWIKHSTEQAEPVSPKAPKPNIIQEPVNNPEHSVEMNAFRAKLHAKLMDEEAQRRAKRLEKAEQVWHSAAPGTGQDAFFKLACAYANAGLDIFEIESLLRGQVIYARTPSERRKEIKHAAANALKLVDPAMTIR